MNDSDLDLGLGLDRRAFLRAGAAGSTALLAATAAREGRAEPVSDDVASIGKTPHTRFAVNVEMWWTKVPFLDRIRRAAELGFPAVEIWPYQNRDVDRIAALCKELKIAIAQFTAWGFTPGMNHPDNEDTFIAAIEEACGIAHRWNCDKMCVVAGNNQPGMTQEQMLAQVVKALKRAAPIAEREKVMLILEPMNGRVDHPGHCLYGSTDAVRICREVNSPFVKINWDLYHMHISEGDLCGHLREGFDQVGYLQLADHPGRNEPGTGEIHYNRVLREAHALGYRGFVGLECRPSGDEVDAARRVAAADVW
ncbi:MAG: TIM barrel protein [Planctomycetes bacterium]|nr:TIM barrel protein [Planctomycetota bacterium]